MNRKGYEINHITNTITVSKKFLEQASTLGGDTYDTMEKLRALGMPILLEKSKKRKAPARLTYKKMLHHINCLADADHYLAEFEAARNASKGEEHPYTYMKNWYESTFPNHASVPEFDENLRIVNTPANYGVVIHILSVMSEAINPPNYTYHHHLVLVLWVKIFMFNKSRPISTHMD